MDRVETFLCQATVGLTSEEQQVIREEMRADLNRLIDEGQLAGLSHQAAIDRALELFGCPRQICRGFQHVYLVPKLQQGSLMLLSLALLVVCWSTLAQWRPVPYCVQTNPDCIQTQEQWVALDRVLEAFQHQGATITRQQITSSTDPQVSNQVYRVALKGGVLELPAGPDRILEDKHSHLPLPLARVLKVENGQTYIHKDELYSALMDGTSLPVTVRPDAKTRSEIITVGDSTLMVESVAVRELAQDPFLMKHWQRLGVTLHQQTGHPIHMQSHTDNAVYTMNRHLKQGVYAVVYWYPDKDGLGFTVGRPDANDNVSFQLPLKPGREVSQMADITRNGTEYVVLQLGSELIPLTYPQ